MSVETEERQTVAAFAAEHGITLTSEAWHENLDMADSAGMHHWKCRLRCGRRSMVIYFSKGRGHDGERPTVEEVLDCVASDAVPHDNGLTFEEWAAEYGFDTDSRKAERAFNASQKTSARLAEVIGTGEAGDVFDALLYKTARE